MSTNRKALRYLAGLADAPGRPRGALMDAGTVCLLHQIYRIMVQLVSVHGMVSLRICLSRLVKGGSIFILAAYHIGNAVAMACKRVVQPSSRHAVADSRRLLGMTRPWRFHFAGDGIVHYCRSGRSGPCCRSREKSAEAFSCVLESLPWRLHAGCNTVPVDTCPDGVLDSAHRLCMPGCL